MDFNSQQAKEESFLSGGHKHIAQKENFAKIPGMPVAYWVSIQLISVFEAKKLSEICETRKGLATSDNNRFLKLWHEVSNIAISFVCNSNNECKSLTHKWFPLNKGGEFRRWYGNNEYVINWENDGYEIRNFKDESGKLLSRPQNLNYNFKQALTWTKITSSLFSARMCFGHALFDDAAAICYSSDVSKLFYVLGFLNSKCCQATVKILNPTMNIQIGDIGNLPIAGEFAHKRIIELVQQNISISKTDWDSFETSWDFIRHPLIEVWGLGNYNTGEKYTKIQACFKMWEINIELRFSTLKQNEEELNRIFIEIYGLQDELTPEVSDKDVTIRKIDLQRGVKSLISYAVGCMFGRYSLDKEALVYAGGEWDATKYNTYSADKDNIIPICDDEYFPDDIVGRFVRFIEAVYGKETLEENLKFIADALSGKGMPRDVIRNYFLNDFYADHCKTYQKRPIYWLFDSGKKNGFKALIYMHRYQPDTIARMRTDYIHEQQERYRTSIAHLEQHINDATTSERVKLNKQLGKLQDQATEIKNYEEKIHHLADQMIHIDLDDGVKHNYEIFKDILAKIK